MDVHSLAQQARKIWGDHPMTLEEIVVAMGVVYGDICRQARKQVEGGQVDEQELQKELGNLIFSTIRWCEDLGYDPATCIRLAQEAQTRYGAKP